MDLEELVEGWHLGLNRITNNSGDSIEYLEYKKLNGGVRVKTKFDNYVYIFENDPAIYSTVKREGEYLILRDDKRLITKVSDGNNFSESYEQIEGRVYNGKFFAKVSKDEKSAFMIFDGKERISSWHDGIDDNFKIKNDKIYGEVWDGEKSRLIIFNGNERLSGPFDSITSSKIISNTIYAEVENNNKMAIIKLNENETKISDWYDDIYWKIDNGTVYGIVGKDGKEAIIKFNGEERLSGWYDEIEYDWMYNNLNGNGIYTEVRNGNKEAIIKFNGKEKVSKWHDGIDWVVRNGMVYGEVKDGKRRYFMKFNGEEKKISQNEYYGKSSFVSRLLRR